MQCPSVAKIDSQVQQSSVYLAFQPYLTWLCLKSTEVPQHDTTRFSDSRQLTYLHRLKTDHPVPVPVTDPSISGQAIQSRYTALYSHRPSVLQEVIDQLARLDPFFAKANPITEEDYANLHCYLCSATPPAFQIVRSFLQQCHPAQVTMEYRTEPVETVEVLLMKEETIEYGLTARG